MELWLWVVIGILGFLTAALTVKVCLLKRSAGEIAEGFAECLATDTNHLITVSGRDKSIRGLADEMNGQLRRLREQRHRFEQGDLELKEAVTNISHDLRTPLTAICGYLELLEQEEKSEAAKRYLEQIDNRVEALKQLTEELFRYSVVCSVKEQGEEKRLDLRRCLEESLLSFYGAMEQRGIVPFISMPEGAVERFLEPSALSRIFGNIISNALKYSDGDLEVTMDEQGTILFSNHAKELNAVAAARLFDRFFTVETGRNATGLGLSIAKLLTERMGGGIWSSYESGKLTIGVEFHDISKNNKNILTNE